MGSRTTSHRPGWASRGFWLSLAFWEARLPTASGSISEARPAVCSAVPAPPSPPETTVVSVVWVVGA